MAKNYLKLNMEKNEILLVGDKSLVFFQLDFTINIDGVIVYPSSLVYCLILGYVLNPI